MKYMRHTFKIRVVSLILALGMFITTRSTRLNAAEPVDNKEKQPVTPAAMPEVVVTGQKDTRKKSYKTEKSSSIKYTEPLRDTPQTITVVPEVVMQEQNATTLRQVLNNVPGISMQAGEGGVPAGDNLTIRGFSARTDLFVDGVRDFGGYTRDSFNFEQIEVVKGPASTYNGRGSTGGSVNLSSKAPQLKRSYKGTVGVGTDQYKRTTVDLNQPLKIGDKGIDGAAFRLNALVHDNDVPGRDAEENFRWGIAPSLAFGLETSTRLILSYFHLGQKNVPSYGLPFVPNTNTAVPADWRDKIAPVDSHNFYGLTQRDYEKTTTDMFTIKFEHDVNDSVTVRNLMRYGHNYRDSILTSPRFLSNTNLTINRQFQSRDQVDSIWINQTDVLSTFETWKFNHSLVTGLELASERSQNHARTATAAPTADLFEPNPEASFAQDVVRTGAVNKTLARSFAFYGFDTIALHEKWDLIGGLRWDYFDTEFRATDAAGNTPEFPKTDSILSWRSGLVFKPVEIGSVYFAYGTSANPSAEGLTLSTNAATNASNFNSLDPETSRTFEVGTKWDVIKEKLSLSAAAFNTRKTNARTEDPNNPNDIVVLEGVQQVQGIELGASGNVTDDWAVFAAYTFLKSEILESKVAADVGQQLPNTPGNTFNFWTTYQLPFNFEVGSGLRYVDRRFASNANTRKGGSYIVWDAMAAYKVNENITVRLNALNLTDQYYIGQMGGGHAIPGEGRSATLTTEFQF